jgi:hypothetical protein
MDVQEIGPGKFSYKPRRVFSGAGAPFVSGLTLIEGDIYIDDASGDHYEYDGAAWVLKFSSAITPGGELEGILTVVPPFGAIQFPGLTGNTMAAFNGDGELYSTQEPIKKIYRALLTQSGTDAPVATVLENSLGGTVVWTRNTAGEYLATLASAFPAAKTFFRPVIGTDGGGSIQVIRASDNAMQVATSEGDDILNGNPFEILVYP